MEQTLLLNATYEPLKVVDWRKAVTLWCQGKVEVISVHDREVRSVSISFKLPSVIRLLRYIRIKRRIDYVPFSRANIYARDRHHCQYCGHQAPTSELTFDHVIPVAHGGRKDWENIVTCCVSCNRRKGGRTPEEAGMRLTARPADPTRRQRCDSRSGCETRPKAGGITCTGTSSSTTQRGRRISARAPLRLFQHCQRHIDFDHLTADLVGGDRELARLPVLEDHGLVGLEGVERRLSLPAFESPRTS